MPNDQYDNLLKADLQQLAIDRDLDPEGTVPVLKERLREYDKQAVGLGPNAEAFQDDDEEEEDEETPKDDEEPEPEAAAMADAEHAPELNEGYFRHTITAGNTLFFENPEWNAANEELALQEAANNGYRHHPSMGKVERVVQGNQVHYQFPVESV